MSRATQAFRIDNTTDLPPAIVRSLGIGHFRAKVFKRSGGEVIAKATQGLGEVAIRLIELRGDRAKSIEVTEAELHKVLLMARDVRKSTGQLSEQQSEEAWLEQN